MTNKPPRNSIYLLQTLWIDAEQYVHATINPELRIVVAASEKDALSMMSKPADPGHFWHAMRLGKARRNSPCRIILSHGPNRGLVLNEQPRGLDFWRTPPTTEA